jgi:hypothetical protein
MLYLVLLLPAAVLLAALVRLRVRLIWSEDHRRLFFGLGRSGPEFDLVRNRGIVRICGVKIKAFDLKGGKSEATGPKGSPSVDPAERKPGRRKSLADWAVILPSSANALRGYAAGLWRAATVEELEGRVEGGFESPDLTGRVYGYYQAALGIAPALAGRFRFVPDWSGAPWHVTGRFCLAVPLYRFVLSTIVLLYKLPKRDLIRLIRGEKGGDRHGE